MKIRPGRQAPVPAISTDDGDTASSPRIRQGQAPAFAVVEASEMTLPHPALSDDRIDQTRVLFQEFLDHLDRLGLAEPATHVSLGFERFLAMYPADATAG